MPPKAQAKSVVPELLVKKRKRDEQWAAERAAAALESRKAAKTKRKDIFKRAAWESMITDIGARSFLRKSYEKRTSRQKSNTEVVKGVL